MILPRCRVVLLSVAMTALVSLLVVGRAAAQSGDGDCSCRPFWQIGAAALLGAFIAVIVMLMATRWRRLFGGRDHDE